MILHVIAFCASLSTVGAPQDCPLPPRAPAIVKTGNEDPQRWIYVNSFLSVATTMVGVAVRYGRDPWQDADNAGYFSPCVNVDDPASTLQCHLTVAQRRSLYGQVVAYYRSLGPHYFLPH